MLNRSVMSFNLVLCCLSLILVCPRMSRAESLNEFVASVKQSNPELEAQKKVAAAEKFRANASGYWDDPFVAVGPDEVPTSDRSAGMMRYQISQTIPFPGRKGARKDAALAQASASEASAVSAERELTVIAVQLYARAFYSQSAITTNREQQKLLGEVLNSTRSRYKTGTGGHHELILAQIEISTLEAEFLRLSRELKVLKAKMNELKSAPPSRPISLETVFLSVSVPKSFEEAMKGQPELLATEAALEVSGSELRSAKLSYFPDIVLQGMYMQPRGEPMAGGMGATEPVESPSYGFMVGVSLPIFFLGKQSNLSSAAKAGRDAISAQRLALENRLRTEWLEATAQEETAEGLVRLYKKEIIPNTELAARTGRSAYVARRLPLSQFVEILRAQRTQSLEQRAAEIDVAMAKLRKIYLLSRAPQFRLAPMRPTLFGGASMGGMDESNSGAVNMGSGMRSPIIQKKTGSQQSDSSGMGGM